jgi:hypothetical protein
MTRFISQPISAEESETPQLQRMGRRQNKADVEQLKALLETNP